MHVHLNDQDISKIPEDIRCKVLGLLDWVENSPSDTAITKRKKAARVKLKQKVIGKYSHEVPTNGWKCERWNLTGWTVKRQK